MRWGAIQSGRIILPRSAVLVLFLDDLTTDCSNQLMNGCVSVGFDEEEVNEFDVELLPPMTISNNHLFMYYPPLKKLIFPSP